MKDLCHYCQQVSTRSLEICTLPGVEHVVLVCHTCKQGAYAEDYEAKYAVHAAELLLASLNGDERVLQPELRRLRYQLALAEIFGAR